MHEKPEGRSNQSGTRPPQKPRKSQDLEGSGDIKGGTETDICGETWTSISSSHDLQMTPQEAHHNTLCPQWKIVLNAMIESRLNEMQRKAIKQALAMTMFSFNKNRMLYMA